MDQRLRFLLTLIWLMVATIGGQSPLSAPVLAPTSASHPVHHLPLGKFASPPSSSISVPPAFATVHPSKSPTKTPIPSNKKGRRHGAPAPAPELVGSPTPNAHAIYASPVPAALTNQGAISDSNSENLGGIIAGIIIGLLILMGIGLVSYYCTRKGSNTTTMEVDAPTMEKFFQELAEEKPVRFTAQQLCTFTQNYSTLVGSGGFGKVYKGTFPNGVNIAVKVLNRGASHNVEEQFMAEVGTIGRTHHINLVRLYGFCYDHFMSALIYEYMENGSLDRHLFSKNRELEWEKFHEIAVSTAKGIAYLHEECKQRIIHYDIKPENVLLDEHFSPKVADFSLAKLCNRDATHVSISGCRGTLGYLAPEFMLRNFPITYKCDVYSFGILLFEILGRRRNVGSGGSEDSFNWFPKHVWEEYEKGKLISLIKGCGIEEKDGIKAERMAKVALWCVQDSPGERPPMSAVVKMLEGGVDIMEPPKPFHYLFSVGTNMLNTSDDSGTVSGYSTSDSYWYKETTPIMSKHEIQVASQ